MNYYRAESAGLKNSGFELPDAAFWEKVRAPGLTPASVEIRRLVAQLPKELAVFAYKRTQTALWAIFLGGTGTGKSTLFNALCGKTLSETGVERPKTFGPIVYAPHHAPLEPGFPLPTVEIKRIPPDSAVALGYAGASGQLLLIEHQRDDLAHLVLVDTPDLDSLEARNRQIVEDFYLLADVVVFVTSEEKYADEVPFQFLGRIHREGKLYFLLLNKVGAVLTPEEVTTSLRSHGIDIPDDRYWVLPYMAARPSEGLPRDRSFNDFTATFLRTLDKRKVPELLRQERRRTAQELSRRVGALLRRVEEERLAAQQWMEHLEVFFEATCQDLIKRQEAHFNAESREYLQREIRRLFSKYDLLGKPRRFIAQILLSPLRALGLQKPQAYETHQEALLRIRKKIDLTPIRAAIESFNRTVLEKLSPPEETAPLYRKLRTPGLVLTDEEIRARVWEEQDRLVLWLESTFQEMARGIPKSKEWGIYSTSILWGALILALETVVGGGITLLEAVLNSAVAPFVTKGAVELFAYHEIQRIARELGQRYEEGLFAVIRQQRDRYQESLASLMPPQDARAQLESLGRRLEAEAKGP